MLIGPARQRLISQMAGEPLAGTRVVAKCAAGLAIVFLLALIGADGDTTREAHVETVPARFDPPVAPESAEVHRRRLFDLRRERYACGAPTPDFAQNN